MLGRKMLAMWWMAWAVAWWNRRPCFEATKTVALVAGPFCRGFLRPNADADSAVRVLLVLVEAVYVIFGGLD